MDKTQFFAMLTNGLDCDLFLDVSFSHKKNFFAQKEVRNKCHVEITQISRHTFSKWEKSKITQNSFLFFFTRIRTRKTQIFV